MSAAVSAAVSVQEPPVVTAARLRFNREFISRVRVADQVLAVAEESVQSVSGALDEFPASLSVHAPFGDWMTHYVQGLSFYLADFRRCLAYVRDRVSESSVRMRCDELKPFAPFAMSSPPPPLNVVSDPELEAPLSEKFKYPELPDVDKLICMDVSVKFSSAERD